MLLVEFYKGAPDLVRFQEPWSQEHSYLDKLKVRPHPSPGTAAPSPMHREHPGLYPGHLKKVTTVKMKQEQPG